MQALGRCTTNRFTIVAGIATAAFCAAWLFPTPNALLAKEKFLTVKEQQPVLEGRVTDAKLTGLRGVQLKLTSPDNKELGYSVVTQSDGSFVIRHDPCRVCRLEVYPPAHSSLASAFLENISGEVSRRMVIELQDGMPIEGRIVHNGEGLKGLTVMFLSIDGKSELKTSAHGGGWTKTSRGGTFNIMLTPGLKKVEISNSRYKELPDHYQTKITITHPGTIADIALPAVAKDEVTP